MTLLKAESTDFILSDEVVDGPADMFASKTRVCDADRICGGGCKAERDGRWKRRDGVVEILNRSQTSTLRVGGSSTLPADSSAYVDVKAAEDTCAALMTLSYDSESTLYI